MKNILKNVSGIVDLTNNLEIQKLLEACQYVSEY